MNALKMTFPTALKSAIMIITAALSLVCGFGFASAASAQSASDCISFESPLSGSVFSAPSCTVSLRVTCEDVNRVDLQARYFPENGDSAVIVSLGTITRPPYKLIWNTHNLPNQLFTGVGILAEATIGNTELQIARQEGIFLTHNRVDRKRVGVHYALNAFGAAVEDITQKFDLGDGRRSGRVVVVWNEKGLVVRAAVKDNEFYINEPGKNMAEVGVEILLDPARKRAPHPADSVLFFIVPLSGNPYRINYTTEIAGDGSFKLVPHSSRINYQHHIAVRDFEGYEIELVVPKEAFGGKALPDTLGANIVLRTLDKANLVQKFPLTPGSMYEMYSPFTWSEYYRLPKPVYMNSALQWTVFFAAGFILSLIVYLLITKLRKPQILSNFERSEEDKGAFLRVNGVVEQELVRKDLSLEYVAKQCGLQPQALNTLVKRNTGFTFANYLQYCRTEVAKERLRSSRSSEKSIADLCGFTSAMEMEKCFMKFHHTTPYKFRMQQQVA